MKIKRRSGDTCVEEKKEKKQKKVWMEKNEERKKKCMHGKNEERKKNKINKLEIKIEKC